MKQQYDVQKSEKRSAKISVDRITKSVACSALLAGMFASNVGAINIGGLKINPDIGVSMGVNSHNDSALNNAFLLGGYARVWIGGDFTFAPIIKYNYVL